MKKLRFIPVKGFLPLFLLLAFHISLNAQCNFEAGDLAFTGYQAYDDDVSGLNRDDSFSFVLLRDAPAGTEIFFTDLGWTSDNRFQQFSNAPTDGVIKWTSPAGGLLAGTQVVISGKHTLNADKGLVVGVISSQESGKYLSLGIAGDQIFAFTGTLSSPTLLAGININKENWDSSLNDSRLSSSSSVMPSALQDGQKVSITNAENNAYNSVFASTSLDGVAANIIPLLDNASNWLKDATKYPDAIPVAFNLPSQSTFTLNPPEIISSPQDILACPSDQAVFSAQFSNSCLIKWQVSTDGNNYTDLENGGVYSGVNTSELRIGNVNDLDGRSYRAMAQGATIPNAFSEAAKLTVVTEPLTVSNPSGQNQLTYGDPETTFTITASQYARQFTWQVSTDGGLNYVDLSEDGTYSGVNTSQLRIISPVVDMNGYRYRIKVTDYCNTTIFSEPLDLEVSPFVLNIELAGIVSKTYDAKTNANLDMENYTFSSPFEGDEVELSNFESGNFEDKNVGENKKIEITGLSLIGASSSNYKLSTTSLNDNIGIISSADLKVDLIGESVKIYDGNTVANLDESNYSLTGLLEGDDVNLLNYNNGEYDSKIIGSSKEITVLGLGINGADAINYALTSTSVSENIGTITAGSVEIELIGEVVKNYDGNSDAILNSGNFQVTGIVNGDDVALNKNLLGSYDSPEPGNGKLVTVSGIELTGDDSSNYLLENSSISAPIGTIIPNTPPVASNVLVEGDLLVGRTLSASYSYFDEENDEETGSLYQWYRSTDLQGTGKTPITGAQGLTYQISDEDINNYISLEVTPFDSKDYGQVEESILVGPIRDFTIVESISRLNTSPTNESELQFSISFNQNITGLTINDLQLTGSGSSTGVISSISGSGSSYTVIINEVNGSGTLRLDFIKLDGIYPPANNNFVNGEEYVIDFTPPTAIAQNVTVQLNENGIGTILPSQIDNGSNDNLSQQEELNLSLDITSFNCSNIGPNTVTLKVTDEIGNFSTATSIVTVEDNIAPTVVTQDLTVGLDANGLAAIVPSDIDNGSFDNCEIDTRNLDIDSFSCSDVGTPVTVILTVTDVNGNESSETATVIVEDNVAPSVVTQDITVGLDENGSASIVPSDIDNGSSDNCEIDKMILDIDNFDCSDVGTPVKVTLTVTDIYGNISSETATVTVEDEVAPKVIPQDITVQLDDNGTATISPADVDNGSSDNCGIDTMSLDQTKFSCEDVGENTVVLSVIDVNGNVGTASAVVTVIDKTAPVILTQNITVQLDADGNASITPEMIDNGSSDSCGIAEMSLDLTDFECSNIGENTVILIVEDNNGNVSSAEAIVTVEDSVAPVSLTQDLTVQLDVDGNASITPEMIDNGSSDACGIAEMSLDLTDFDCSNIGENIVILKVEDNNGNISQANAIVTVEDNVAPVAIAQNITVQLNENGMVSIIPEDIDNGSTDACGIANLSLDITEFNCDNIGDNEVFLTVEDENGNISKATSIVTVEDNVAPVAIAQNITVQLNENGMVSITPEDIDNGSTDACRIANLSLDITEFNCDNIGDNEVVLTVEDENGNISKATSIVTVEDNVAPQAIAQNITVQLDENGVATITPENIDNGSVDACGNVNLSLDITEFNCDNIGDNEVVLSVEDENGNTSQAITIVTVEDNVAPILVTQDITVQLDENGTATIVPADVNNGSSDNCGIASMSLDINSFSCSDVNNPVTVALTVKDSSGIESSETATVTVKDNLKPVVVVKDLTVQLDVEGNATITPEMIDNGSNDACGISEISLDITEFNCENVGENEVTLTVTDVNGNKSAATAVVTVEDIIAPIPDIAELEDVIVKCEVVTGRITAPTATDNCAVLTATTSDPLTYDQPGSYTITWNFDDGNGNTTMQTQNVIVEPSPLNAVTFDDESFVYNGIERSLEVKNLPEGATVDYSISPETETLNGATNVGEYSVTARLSSGSETCPDTELTATLTIEKAQAEITAEATQTFTYDGNVKNVAASLNHSETELTYTPQQGYTDAGTYSVTVASAETENHLSASKEVSLVVEKAEITGVAFEDDTFTYDGSEHSIYVSGLPDGAEVSYENNGKTNAGNYTVSATISQENYNDLVLSAQLSIKKAEQAITFDEIEDRNQLADEHFQLNATSTSGLPVTYSYTYETENPAATVGPRGFVRILGGGQITITAMQSGNQNYEAATPVVRTLTINGSEARLNTAVINGVTYSNPTEDIYYLIGCGSSENEVQIQLEQNQGSSIDRDNSFTMSTPAPGIYRETVTVTSEDGNSSQTYNITVEKNFNFEDIVIQKFNNVMLVNNNPETNGGYNFVSYRWYKDGSVIGNGQYFSAGNDANDQLDVDSSYYVVLETEDGEILKTCTSEIQLRSSLNVSLAPNPVSSGGTMELLADFPKEELETMQLSIHNLNGMLLKQMKSNRKSTNITLPYNLQMGVYILKIKTENISRSLKFIIR